MGPARCFHAAASQMQRLPPLAPLALPPLHMRAPAACSPGTGARSLAVMSQGRNPAHWVRGPMRVAAAAAPQGEAPPAGGLPFALSRPWRQLRFSWGRRVSGVKPWEMQVEVDAMIEGSPAVQLAQGDGGGGGKRGAAAGGGELEALLRRVQADCGAAVPLALAAKKARKPRWPLPALAAVSLVLCDDAYIRALNAAHRGKDAATDVLSFEVPDEPGEVPPPVKLLGDLVISLDTAARQARERG